MTTGNQKNQVGQREIVMTVFALLAVLVAIVHFGSQGDGPAKLKGIPAPEIEFETREGSHTSLRKKQGTVILLNFWASWCAPCIEEMPSLRMLESHFASKGFLLLAFNIEETPETMKGTIDSSRFPRNLIFNFSKASLRPYNVDSIPLSVLIDKEGVVREVYVGPKNWMDLGVIRTLDALLK